MQVVKSLIFQCLFYIIFTPTNISITIIVIINAISVIPFCVFIRFFLPFFGFVFILCFLHTLHAL